MTRFEFTVEGTPISQQAKKRRVLNQWKAQVRNTARKYWPHKEPPARDQIRMTLTYFYKFEPGHFFQCMLICSVILSAAKNLFGL
jgi:hypothetical protein